MDDQILATLGKSKGNSNKTIIAIFGVLILLGAVIAGILLIGQQQIFQQQAATPAPTVKPATAVNTKGATKICGQTCTSDSDCKPSSGGNYKTICATQSDGTKQCANPNCLTDTQSGTICSCITATQKCGQICGDQGTAGGGLYPLCGDGVSSCGPALVGPVCSGLVGTYCMPANPQGGYALAACTGNNTQYNFLTDPNGKPITTAQQVQQACAIALATSTPAPTIAATATPTSTPTQAPTSAPTASPTKMPIPVTGFDTPTILLILVGVTFIATSLYLFVH